MSASAVPLETPPLPALAQCLVRLGAAREPGPGDAPEVLGENRFLAARDGMEARLVQPSAWGRRPVRDRLAELLDACAPIARVLGCEGELADVARLAADPGAARQRRSAARAGSLEGLVAGLAGEFV